MPARKGSHQSQETVAKRVATMRASGFWNRGMRHSSETKALMSSRLKQYWADHPEAREKLGLRHRGVRLAWNRTALRNKLSAPIEHPTMLDIAWAAGIVEGEGNIRVAGIKRSGSKCANVRVGQKVPWLCERLHRLFGGRVKTKSRDQRYANGGGCYTPLTEWRLLGVRARGFLMTIYTFLSPHKQAQAREAIAIG